MLPLTLALAPIAACDKGDDGGDSTTTSTTQSGDGDGDTSGDGDGDGDGPDVGGGELRWYTTCGDPVCGGYSGPYPNVPMCPDIQAGDPCDTEGATCDFQSDCNALFVCATADPKQQDGGCPISRAAFKQDIRYLDAGDRATHYQTLLDMRLATWRYRDRADGKTSLGVILEDGEQPGAGPDGGPAIWTDSAHDRVDLYSYGSLAIAGVQVHADELAELRTQMQAMQRELAELREQAQRCQP